MTEKNPYSDLDEKGVKEQIALFKEALEGKDSVDLYTEFSLEKPKEITDDEKAKFAALEENNDKLSQITKLLGVSDSKNSGTEPTAAEKELFARQDKLETVALNDKIAEIKSVNSEFDSKTIEQMEIPTADKVIVAGSIKEIIKTYQSGYDKLKSELTSSDASTTDTKLSSDKQNKDTNPDTSKEGAGKDIVAKFAAKHNLKTEDKTKTEDK